MKGKIISSLCLLIIAGAAYCGAVTGCGGDGGNGPGVVSVNDLDGATGVPVDSSFRYTFDKAVNRNSVTEASYFIVPAAAASAQVAKAEIDPALCDPSGALAAGVGCQSFAACDLTPEADLAEATQYAVCLTTDILHNDGSAFEGFMAQFTTAGSSPGSTYTIGGTVAGLGSGESVLLQNNEADDLTVSADGPFTFATELADGAAYAVTVLTGPASKTCTVGSGTGTVAGADVTDVNVVCSVNTYTVGGMVSGLEGGKSVILQNNAADDLTLSADGEFTFATAVADGGAYEVTVKTQPEDQRCTVSSGSGSVAGADITDVAVECLSPWARSTVTAPSTSFFWGAAADQEGNFYVVGFIGGTDEYGFGNDVTVSGAHTSENLVIVKYSPGGAAQWARSVESAGDSSSFTSVAVDAAGNAYAVGSIYGNGEFDFGDGVKATGEYTADSGSRTNALIVKYNRDGVPQWAKSTIATTGGPSKFYGVGIDADGNAYATGDVFGVQTFTFGEGVSTTSVYALRSALIVKYNSQGEAQWAKTPVVAPSLSQFRRVAVDAAGNAYAVGHISEDAEFDFGNDVKPTGAYDAGDNAVIVKYNAAGQPQWARTTEAAADFSSFESVALDGDGNAYAVGNINKNGAFDFGDGVLPVSGAADSLNAVIVKYSGEGVAQWAKSVVEADVHSQFYDATLDPAGDVYASGVISKGGEFDFGGGVTAAGAFNGTNAVIVKYSAENGAARWAKTTEEAGDWSHFWKVVADGRGDICAVGYMNKTGDFDFGNGKTVSGAFNGTNAVIVKYLAE